MKLTRLSSERMRRILRAAGRTRCLVVGDVMLDQFIWGSVARISPEAPVPVVDFERESFMPGGAANVARNLTSLGVPTELFGAVGRDYAARQLQHLLSTHRIGCRGLLSGPARPTSVKTRIVAHKQQVVRIDRQSRQRLTPAMTRRLLKSLKMRLQRADAVILGDYGKGVITPELLADVQALCRAAGVWLSLDPKPVSDLTLTGFSL